MAIAVINSVTRPVACDHVHLGVTVGGQARTVIVSLSDLRGDDEHDQAVFFGILRHMIRTAGASNFAQARTALEGKTVFL